jgi:hypothetical protein
VSEVAAPREAATVNPCGTKIAVAEARHDTPLKRLVSPLLLCDAAVLATAVGRIYISFCIT